MQEVMIQGCRQGGGGILKYPLYSNDPIYLSEEIQFLELINGSN